MTVNDIGWNLVAERGTVEMCRGADAIYNAERQEYTLLSFGKPVRFNLATRTVDCSALYASEFPEHIEEHLVPALLWYLAKAQELSLAGELIPAAEIPGGQIFVKGTHVLPLCELARAFDGKLDTFLARGRTLGGQPLLWGDASVQLYPVPRVPVALVCWAGDEDFPFKTSVLFDRSCSLQLPTDMLWSLAMAAVFLMTEP